MVARNRGHFPIYIDNLPREEGELIWGISMYLPIVTVKIPCGFRSVRRPLQPSSLWHAADLKAGSLLP